MLSPGFALGERALWEKRLGAGVNGSHFDGAVEVKCRLDGKRIFLPPLDAGPGDRITIGARVFILKEALHLRDLSGRLSHIEGELT